jgi:hypothetical protein
MMETTVTAVVALSGLDEIDAHRHIARAVADLFDDLDNQLDRDRADAIDKPCRHRAAIDRTGQLGVHHANLIRHITHLSRAIRAGDLGEAERLTHELGDLAARVAAGIDLTHRALDAGCSHTCPELPRTTGDIDRFTSTLLDRLDAAGFTLARNRP